MNSWHIQQLKFAVGIGGFMSFYGVVGLVVWVLGEKMGFPTSQRVVVIALVLLTMPLALIVGYVATRRSKKKEEKLKAEAEGKVADKPDGEQPAKVVAPTGNYDDITKSTDEVVQFLKTSNLGEAGKDAVYSLPWYLVAGIPKSGKSSLVIGSNLNFQNLPSQRQSEQKFIRSTQSVDWRVTSDAVFVDTAGRYQSEGVDADEWASLLETITKYRKTRPIDGFLLVVNAERILQSSDQEVEQMAKVLRTRLDEVIARTKIRFPVYLIFTNADSIEGFRDSFSTSKGEGKNLVWGATIPIEKSENGQALFDGEYEILHNSLMKRRLMRLSAPFPPVRQLRIFNFPLHFGTARRKIGSFVSTLFRPNPFSENPFLRGFYFTAAPVNRQQLPPGGQTMSNMPQTVGTTYFTERLFRDVILRDKDLVRTLQEQRQRPPILGWALTALGAFLVLSLLTLAGISLFNNKRMLDDASTKGVAVLDIVRDDKGKNPLTKTPDEASKEIKATEDLRQVMFKLDDYERNGAPFYMRMGLYSGNQVYTNLLQIYFNVVEQRFKKPTVARVENELKKFAATPSNSSPSQLTPQDEEVLGKNYDLLKAYLMISGGEEYKKRANAGDISNALKDYWTTESKLPSEQSGVAQQQLEFWAKQSDRESFPRIKLDETIVKAAREKLKAFPAINRYYKRKVAEISKQVDEKIGVTTADGLLTRNNADNAGLIEGTHTVPGAYTREGYVLMKQAIDNADKELGVDDWVMGEQGKSNLAQITDRSKLEEMYLRDYAQQWRDFVKGINVKPYKKDTAKDALQSFSSVSSPMKILVTQIAFNTNFSAKPVATTWWDTITGYWNKKDAVATDSNNQVEKEFQPLFTFMGEPGKPAPVDTYQNAINTVSNKFSGFSVNEINQISQDLAKDNDKQFTELRSANSTITTVLRGFNSTPTGQDVASLLKKPLENLSTLLGADAQKQLEQTWKEQLLPQAKELEKGFPFEDSQTEVDLNKLTAYLAANGTLSKFYEEQLKKYFDGNPGQLKLKESSQVKLSDELVAYLNKMLLLREALYQKNANANFEYEFKLQPVANSLIEGTIDGQPITSDGTGASKLKFPAGAGAETGVFIKISPTSGTISTSGTTPANTSATNTAPTTSNTNSTSKFLQSSNSNSSTTSANPTIKEPGTWGLFRFFYKGNPQKTGSEYSLTYSLGGKSITAIVKPSGGDLFDKELFRTARAPEKFLK